MTRAEHLRTLGLVAPALVVGLLVGCSDDGSSGAGADLLVGASTLAVSGVEFPVVVPSGRWTFTVSAPTDDLPDDVADDATDGTSYVGLAWNPDGVAPRFGPVLGGEDPETATVTTTSAGGEPLQVTLLGPADQGGTANGAVWVAVDEDGSVPDLVVAYDGVDQRFDLVDGSRDPGPADGFYGDLPALDGTCPTRGPTADQAGWEFRVTCEVDGAFAVPYVASQGWVADGDSTWYVVDLRLGPSRFSHTADGRSTDYDAVELSTEVMIDGEAAVENGVTGWVTTVVVPGSASTPATLDIERRYAMSRLGAGPAPPDEELTLRWDVELRPTR